ncbi:MAG: Nramp family divalent metal transporter [Bacteroidia bacterium]|nr:Nramp family divalent metal transporter [Bacteroidia bacterium]
MKDLKKRDHKPKFGALEIFKYIGPGFLVTVGFIDPGNWASNIAAGANFGYSLLWMITLSTVMLIILQHNVAHLGIASGLCLSEAATIYLKPWASRSILSTAVMASVSTALAELLGGAIALNMLFAIPIKIGALIILITVLFMLFSNSYRKLEKWIIGFVSIIGLSFIYELTLVDVDWGNAITGWLKPTFPDHSMLILMSVLGAVVMPHNLFLHSEIIQSRQWNKEKEAVIDKQMKYEFYDTLLSMFVGWAINSAMILLAAATFFKHNTNVTELQQAKEMLTPMLGKSAAVVFAIALLFAGISSCITAGMAGGSIFAGFWGEPYDIKDNHTKTGVIATLVLAFAVILLISNPFYGLLLSQLALSIQLPFTIFLQIYLTSSKKVMGKYANIKSTIVILVIIGAIVSFLNIKLFISMIL